jgi:hypothetical protein
MRGDGAALDEDHGHGLADVLGGHVAHAPRALAVEVDEHRRRAGLLIEAGGGVGDLIAGDDDAALEQDRRPSRSRYSAEPTGPGPRGHPARRARCPPADTPASRWRRAVLQPRRVLGAGQLHDDAPLALALDDGLGDAQRVDAVAQRGDVLLQREALDLLLLCGGSSA